MSRHVGLVAVSVAWLLLLGLGVVNGVGGLFLLLTAYVLSVAYAFQLWSTGDRDGTLALVLVAVVPPVGVVLLALHWFGRRYQPED